MSIESDLIRRDYWRRYLRERSLETLGDRFGISTVTVWFSEIRAVASLTDAENAELKALRDEYNQALANEMPKYRLKAIAARNGVSETAVSRNQQKMIRAKAQQVYQQGIAA